MSALPEFSLAAIQERDEEEEAPSHRSVPLIPMPTSQIAPAQAFAKPAIASPAQITAATVSSASSFNSASSPTPATAFEAQPMLSNAPPDTTGNVSPNYAMSASNDEIVIQDRLGNTLKTTNLDNFWTAVFGTAISPAWDPNVRYDPYAQRWILVDMGAYSYAGSSMLIAVSATSDPTGTWYLRRFQAATNTTFDHPRVGFNNNWIVVTGNELSNSGFGWLYSVVYVFDKADLYANGTKTPAFSTTTTDFTVTPALTYDNTVSTMYLMSANKSTSGTGFLTLSTITGAVDSPVVTWDIATPSMPTAWAFNAPVVSGQTNPDFAPQLGNSTDIGVFDARMNTVVYRNGSVWATHTAFVPASAPTITAVDWIQVGTDGTVQQSGRLQDPNGVYFYAFPSLAVNANGDMLVGYARMAANQYASGGYAFRAASDPAGTLRQEYVMSSGQGGGESSYVHLDGNGVNRWGDYSATQVDPVNDMDFWTVQEFAGTSGSDWGMWWDNVIDPVSSGPSVASVTANPAAVIGPASSTGTVTLNVVAPSGGVSVGLSSNNSAAQVPTSVIVPANAISATFQITTVAVSSVTTGTISASYNGTSQSTNFAVDPPPALNSVSVSPSTVTGGHLSTGTVTISVAAPSGGLSVNLSSSNSTAASVPLSVTVPGGATSATFPITTTSVSSATPVTITATSNSVNQTAILTVEPPGAIALSVVQAQQNFNPNSGSSITANISTTGGSLLVAYVREGSNTTDTFPVTDNLGQTWTLAGYNTFNGSNRSGIYYMPNSGAVSSVTANFTTSGGVTRPGIVVYEIVGAAASSPVDAGPVANTAGTSTSITSAPLTTSNANDILLLAVDTATNQSGANDSFVPGAGFAFPATGAATTVRQAVSYATVSSMQTNKTTSMNWATSASNSGSQFIAFSADPIPVQAALQSVGVNPTSVIGGQSSTGTVTLTSAAPAGGATVSVSSLNTAVAQVSSGTVTVAAGATTATFSITTSSVSTATPVTIQAVYSGVTQSSTLTVNPAAALQSVGVSPTSVIGGGSSTGTVTLTSAAPAGGATVSVSSLNTTVAQVSSGTVTVAAGATTATFTITTSSVSSITPVTIQAVYNGVTQTTTLTVNPPAALQAVGVSPSSVIGGGSSTGTVTLTSAAPAGGATVSISSLNTSVAQISSGTVTVAAGATTANFTITTSNVSASTPVTIQAVYNGVTQTTSLTVTPLSLISLAVSPATVAGGQSASGTVTLNAAAPAGGAAVSVSSSSGVALVPSGGIVTVPSGMTSYTFPITTIHVTSPASVTISASYNSGPLTAPLNVTPLSVVQARQAFNSKSGSSIGATIASTAGDLLVAFVREGTNATSTFTVTDNLGQHWTLAGYNSFSSSERCAIFYMPNSGAVSSVTANFSSSVTRPGIVVYEIAGAAPTTPVDAGPANKAFSASQTSITSAPLSSNNANDILIYAVDLATNQSSFVPGAGFGFASTGTATNVRQAVSFAIVSSLQTNLTTTMSWGTSTKNGASQFIFFRAAP